MQIWFGSGCTYVSAYVCWDSKRRKVTGTSTWMVCKDFLLTGQVCGENEI